MLKPVAENRLELVLVIEHSPSMVIWTPTIHELQRLLETHSAFRMVHSYYLDTSKNPPELFTNHPDKITAHCCQPQTLLSDTQWRSVLLITDCVAAAWYSNPLSEYLAKWGQQMPVAMLNMLPQRLWRGTGLRNTEQVFLMANRACATNQQLQVYNDELWLWDTEFKIDKATDMLNMPILSIDADDIQAWARLLLGKPRVAMLGVQFDLRAEQPTYAQVLAAEDEQDIGEKVQHFLSYASPLARKLAAYLATVPFNLAIMRIMQQQMVQGAQQTDLAEVFLSGLLTQIELPQQQKWFDFHTGARELLLDTIPATEAKRVLQAISEYIDSHISKNTEVFYSFLSHPEVLKQGLYDEKQRYFAEINLNTLKRLGGQYAQIAYEWQILKNTAEKVKPVAEQRVAKSSSILNEAKPVNTQAIKSASTSNQYRTVNAVTWIHLSDLHYIVESLGQQYIDKKGIFDKLLQDIKNRGDISQKLNEIDFIIFSGNLTHSSQADESQLTYKEFLESLLEALNLSVERLYMVGTNNDLDRSKLKYSSGESVKFFEKNDDTVEQKTFNWLQDNTYKNQLLKPSKN